MKELILGCDAEAAGRAGAGRGLEAYLHPLRTETQIGGA